MANKSIVLDLKSFTFSGLKSFALSVHEKMTGNPLYPSPVPTMIDFEAGINDLKQRIINWGVRGNRGSHLDYELLLEAAARVKLDLKSLAAYCTMTTPNDEQAWGSAGFVAKKPGAKVGILPLVQNLRQVFPKVIMANEVKLRWQRPFGLSKWTRISYKVMRSSTSEFSDAVQVGTTTHTTFSENISTISTVQFYWVIPVNSYGDGVRSDLCQAVAWRV